MNTDPSKRHGNHKIRNAVRATATAGTLLLAAACTPSNEHQATDRPAPVAAEAAKSKIEIPTGGDYEIASRAGLLASYDNNFADAEFLMSKVADAAIKEKTARVIDLARAEHAALAASYNNEFDEAEKELESIKDTAVKTRGEGAVDLAESEHSILTASHNNEFDAASKDANLIEDPSLKTRTDVIIADARRENELLAATPNSPDKTLEWNKLNQSVINDWDAMNRLATHEWDALNTDALSAWHELYTHTAAYQEQQNQDQ